MHILIVGSGSIGKRHARNFAARNCAISAMDPREDRLAELAGEVDLRGRFTDLGAAFESGGKIDGVVIGSPPNVHVDQSIKALKADIPVLLEKPVAPSLADARRLDEILARSNVPLLLGYTWRWWPPLHEVKRLLSENAIGRVRHAKFNLSAHLADWHPWERYQDFFMAKQALGGGALLDESHWIDLMLWLFGEPESVYATIEKISDLEIDSDDNVDMLVRYKDGLRVSLHLDLYGRPHEKYIQFTGNDGTLKWSETPNRVALSKSAGQDWTETDYTCERNDMFQAVADEFLGVMDGNSKSSCTLADGLAVLRVIEAARLSSDLGRRVELTEVST